MYLFSSVGYERSHFAEYHKNYKRAIGSAQVVLSAFLFDSFDYLVNLASVFERCFWMGRLMFTFFLVSKWVIVTSLKFFLFGLLLCVFAAFSCFPAGL